MKLHLLDSLIVAIYLIICLIIAFYRAPKIKTPQQFALGLSGLSTPILVCTIFASSVGAGTILGLTGEIYSFGIIFLIGALCMPLFWFISARILAPNIEEFKGCISISQIMYKLYGSPGRWATNISAMVTGLVVIAAQAYATGYIFHYFLAIDITYGVIISYTIMTLYSAWGGTRAVILTEVFQFSLFFFIIPVSYIITLTNTDGLQPLIQKLPDSHLSLDLTEDNIALLGSVIFFFILPSTDSPFIQRCLMAHNAKQLDKVLKTIGLIFIPFTLSLGLITYIVKANSPDIAASDAFIYYIDNYLPLGLKGLMLAGVLAALMAISEAWLNSISIILVNDVFKVFYPKITNKTQLFSLRLAVLLISAISISVAFQKGTGLHLMLLADNFGLPIILVPLCAGVMGFRTTNTSFIVSITSAFSFTLVGRMIIGEFATISLAMGIAGSAIGLFAAHAWQNVGRKRFEKEQVFALILQRTKTLPELVSLVKNYIPSINVMDAHFKHKEMPYQKFAIFTLIYYFIYTFSLTSAPTHKLLSYLLIIGYFLCFVLLLRNVLFSHKFQQKFLPAYWLFALTFCLPLISSYILFASNGDDFWIINGLLSAFSLYFFVDALFFIILFSIGLLLGYILFHFTGVGAEHMEVRHNLASMGYIYLFFLLASLVFLRGREKEQQNKINTMQTLGLSIAHELGTPLSIITMQANKLEWGGLNAANIEAMRSNILSSVKRSKYFIDNALLNFKDIPDGKLLENIDIKTCITDALSNYPFEKGEEEIVVLDIKANFSLQANKVFITHVISNLLNNAIYYTKLTNTPLIQISTNSNNQENIVIIRDNGPGIDNESIEHIFKPYFTKKKGGVGIGLAFCKMVMESLGGSIECISEYGMYTEFKLYFPNK